MRGGSQVTGVQEGTAPEQARVPPARGRKGPSRPTERGEGRQPRDPRGGGEEVSQPQP